jgi:DNA-directed RNA polymerase beta subunit
MLTKTEKAQKIKEWLSKTRLDGEVNKRTVKVAENNISPTLLLAASSKLLKINKKEEEPDDRDHLRFSRFLVIEDYIGEHISRDAGHLQKKAVFKMQQKRNLSWLNAGFFTPQIRSVVIGNPLSQNVDGINPTEHWDNSHRVTKLGPGGIASTDAISDSSRQVQSSSFGFFDPVHIMESDKVGVTNFMTHNVVKGKDNKLYRVMKTKDGKLQWMDHESILDRQVVIPEA